MISGNRKKRLEKQLGVPIPDGCSQRFLEIVWKISKLDMAAAAYVVRVTTKDVREWESKGMTISTFFSWSNTPQGERFWYTMYMSVHHGEPWRGGL